MNREGDGSRSIAARTYGFPPGWLLGGHSLPELYAVAQGVDPRLILQVRQRVIPVSEMTVEELSDRLASLADRAAVLVDELAARAERIRGQAERARSAWDGVRK